MKWVKDPMGIQSDKRSPFKFVKKLRTDVRTESLNVTLFRSKENMEYVIAWDPAPVAPH